MNAVCDATTQVTPIIPAREGARLYVRLLDQTALPHQVRYDDVSDVAQMADAITRMTVRGAPAIGIAAAYAMALSAQTHRALTGHARTTALEADAATLLATRPTAVNLQWALARMREAWRRIDEHAQPTEWIDALWAEAVAIHEADRQACQAIGDFGAALIPRGARIITHCNAGALATGGQGTALGVIRSAFARDPGISALADETRPRLQGARLTAWELMQDGIPVEILPDGAAASLMRAGRIDVAVVGADRIARNGDTANKIGTYSLALAAKAHGIPLYVAAPMSTFDLSARDAADIPIETRDAGEVTHVDGVALCPPGARVINPAFDVTPGPLVTAFITERGVIRPPYDDAIVRVVEGAAPQPQV